MPDPDFEIGGGDAVIQALRKGAEAVSKKFFSAFGPHFGLEIRGGGQAPLPDPPLKPYSKIVSITSRNLRIEQCLFALAAWDIFAGVSLVSHAKRP